MSTPPPGGNGGATSARSLDQQVLIQNAFSSGLPTPAAKENNSVDQLYKASPLPVKKEVRHVALDAIHSGSSNQIRCMCIRFVCTELASTGVFDSILCWYEFLRCMQFFVSSWVCL